MKVWTIRVDVDALTDIQDIINWYNTQSKGLGTRFKKQIVLQISSLKDNPEIYSNRYDEVRCMLIKKFPFLVHYSLNNNKNQVQVFAVFHTSRNPAICSKRNNKNEDA